MSDWTGKKVKIINDSGLGDGFKENSVHYVVRDLGNAVYVTYKSIDWFLMKDRLKIQGAKLREDENDG